jgi:hypothetical protein
MRTRILGTAVLAFLLACNQHEAPAIDDASAASPAPAPAAKATPAMARADFNRRAMRLDLPVFWVADANNDGAPDPSEIKSLLFYSSPSAPASSPPPSAADAIARVLASPSSPAPALPADEAERQRLVLLDLDQGAPTLVYTDLRSASAADKSFVDHMLAAAAAIDSIYETMNGSLALAPRVAPEDAASRSLFRRNRGPVCAFPATRGNPACSAIRGAPKPVRDEYPAELQSDPGFCAALEKLPNAKALLDHFSVVRPGGDAGKLAAVPYTQAYATPMSSVATELRLAAAAMNDPSESALVSYLQAAAQSFITDDWGPADEAWSKMNAKNSRWYARVAPDEVLNDPCGHKAQFHLTLAHIDSGSLRWQEKLAPVEQDMEGALAALVGPPYAARKVTFHLPDFIDIVLNVGDDRGPSGATLGESLPNWGKVAAEGRGRTVAMSNINSDADSLDRRRKRAESLLDADAMKGIADSMESSLLSTILHEATHNLGPVDEYAFHGKKPDAAFGGKLASMLEELKAQTGALYFIDFLKTRGLVSAELAQQTYADSLVWALRHISEGMHNADSGEAYAQLSAIQIGFLLDDGALAFDAARAAANGSDKGAFVIHYDRLPASVEKLMKIVATIKATNDKAGADALVAKYVDGPVLPQKTIAERELRFPQPTFVYAVDR